MIFLKFYDLKKALEKLIYCRIRFYPVLAFKRSVTTMWPFEGEDPGPPSPNLQATILQSPCISYISCFLYEYSNHCFSLVPFQPFVLWSKIFEFFFRRGGLYLFCVHESFSQFRVTIEYYRYENIR